MSAPTPLTPAECDLQDFPFMPLHVARLRDSDLAAEGHPEGCWYAVLLWAASWHQLPAGSLPDNDAVLARLCGLGRDLRTFRKHRADALRGFVVCSDGRLYHPVIAEQVVAAWKSKIEQRHRAECARVKKANQRNGTEIEPPTFAAFLTSNFPSSVPYLSPETKRNVPRDGGSKGERQGQGEGQGDSKKDDKSSSIVERAHRLPVDWFPSDLPETVALLAVQWPPGRLDRELEGFRDFWGSKSKDATKLNWDRTWHNRIRDQHDRIMRENRNGRQSANDGLGINARAANAAFGPLGASDERVAAGHP